MSGGLTEEKWSTDASGEIRRQVVRGDGPPVVLVGGGLDDGRENEPLAISLADAFTVYNYARRGRAGGSWTPTSLRDFLTRP